MKKDFEPQVFPHETNTFKNNQDYLAKRKINLDREMEAEDQNFKKANRQIRELDREMVSLRPEIIQLYKQRQFYAKYLVNKGTDVSEINRLLEEWSMENDSSAPGGGGGVDLTDLPHNNDETWYESYSFLFFVKR